MSAESLNTCILSGNIGNDAEVRYTAGGMAITSFSLAVNHRRKQQVCQMVVVPFVPCDLVKVEKLSGTERGEDGFGSTGIE